MGFIIPAIKAVAAVVAKSVIAKAVVKVAAAAIISKVATKAISKLIAKRAGVEAPSGADAGARVQLAPASDNKLPIVYGTAWVGGPIIDAKISVDQKYMWYVIALCEKPNSQTITFDTSNGVYYGGKLVSFGSNGAVAALVTNNSAFGPAQSDTKMANKIYIWLFQNGAANAGVNTGGQTAIQIMSDAVTGGGISNGWNSSIYTSGGESVQLNDMAFAIVRVEYNVDATTTSLDTLQVKVTNNMGGDNGCKPGVAILDYLTNTRYGCAIDLQYVDTASLTALDVYADEYIDYVPVGGGSAQQRRYRVNGPLDTANDCLTNLQFLADTADSWLQYTETSGKWRIIPNKPYTGSLLSLYNVNDDVLIGGIQINPIDLNDTFNQVEVAYPNTNVKDQTDYQIVDLTDPTTAWYPIFNQVLSPNEAINKLNIALPLVNNAVQALYLAVRRLLQSREDLVITLQLDYSGIQIDAGDVIRVNHNAYGWTDKLFRVSGVSEVQDENGNLSALIEAFEYNDSIYADNAIQDFVPADNTGLSDPNVISPPCPPTFSEFTDDAGLLTGFNVTSCVPDDGVVIYMDFNYGRNANVVTHQLYRTVQNAGGLPFTNSDSANGFYNNVTISVNDLGANTYYWSTTARNDTAGRYSDASAPFNWGGANIQPWDPNTGNGGIIGNQIRPNTVTSNNIADGTITGNKIANYTITGNNIANFTITGNNIANFSIGSNKLSNTGVVPGCYSGGTICIGADGRITSVTGQGTDAGPVLYVSAGFNIPNFDTGVSNVPVYANSTSTRNIPIVIPAIANVGIWPYAQGTSNTANGYASNSTGIFTPTGAALLYLNKDTEEGFQGWYKVITIPVSNVGWSDGESVVTTISASLLSSDTVNETSLQIVPFIATPNSGNDNILQTHDLFQENFLTLGSMTRTFAIEAQIAAGDITRIGFYARAIANIDVTIYSASYVLEQGYIANV